MLLKSLFALALAGALGGGCTCSGEAPGADSAGTPPVAPTIADTETEPVPGIPAAAPRVGEAERVVVVGGGLPRTFRKFEYPTFGATEFDVTMDLADGVGDDIQRHAQLALAVRARIVKSLPHESVRWTLEIIEATANETDGVEAAVVASARARSKELIGARALIDNDKRGRWLSTTIEQGTPSGRRAMASLLDAIETLRGISHEGALGEQAQWGYREVRTWQGIETKQTTQYGMTHVEDMEIDYNIKITRKANNVPAPGGGVVEALVAQGGGRGTVRFDRVMPTGHVTIATTAKIVPRKPDAGRAAAAKVTDASDVPAPSPEPPNEPPNDGDANTDGDRGDDASANDNDNATPGGEAGAAPDSAGTDDGAVIRKSKMQIAVTARDAAE